MKTGKIILLFIALIASVTASGETSTKEMRNEADRLYADGKNDSALIVAQKALDIAEKEKDTTAIIGLNSSVGVYLRTQGKFDEALKHYETALKLCTTESFKKNAGEEERQEVAAFYTNFAVLNFDMENSDEAVEYSRKACEWAEKCTDNEFKTEVLTNNGIILMTSYEFETAIKMLTQAYNTAMKHKMYPAALKAGAYMASLSDYVFNTDDTEMWKKRCQELVGKVTDTKALIAYRQVMCAIALENENWREAIDYFNQILSTKGVDDMPYVLYDCYNNLHEVWAKLGEWHKAYDCLGRAKQLRDSLFEERKAKNIHELTVKYETKEKELALARSEAELSRTHMYVAFAAIVVLVCAVLVSLYVQRQRRAMRRREAEFARLKADVGQRLTRRYLEGLESERERLAKELHDGVCNSLYTVQLMAVKMAGEQTDKGVTGGGQSPADGQPADDKTAALTGMIDDIRSQVRRVSHELMPPEFRYADISMVIADYVATAAEASGCVITYTPSPDDADWKTVPDSTALELYRITQEAVNNALKHAAATKIDVSLGMAADGVTLTVTDNGNAQRQGGRGGIGRRTMKQRADAINATLDIRQDDTGTTVSVKARISK